MVQSRDRQHSGSYCVRGAPQEAADYTDTVATVSVGFFDGAR